jgi:hypothetical protein
MNVFTTRLKLFIRWFINEVLVRFCEAMPLKSSLKLIILIHLLFFLFLSCLPNFAWGSKDSLLHINMLNRVEPLAEA